MGATDAVTVLLAQVSAGQPDALDRLIPVVYEALRQIARRRLREEHPGHTLSTTGLVHETYLKLIGAPPVEWRDRVHFFGVAANAMRRILIDHARTRHREKRGGPRAVRVSLSAALSVPAERDDDMIALDDALTRLESENPRYARVVECRFFVGLTLEETAEVLGVSLATVKRDWAFCRAWLNRALRKQDDEDSSDVAGVSSNGPLDDLRAVVQRSVAAPNPPVPDRIGAYDVVELIARGGMGAVYLGRRSDGQPGQHVAIKLMRTDADAPPLREHFLNERRILERIEHPNIARFLDGGFTAAGQPYFVMEYVDGQPIDRYCAARALSLDARLALFRTVCDAVQHAHQHRVVHRDIKPANVFVGADGVVKLLDFGIARVIDPDPVSAASAPARVSLRLLTPEYASPEQKAGERVTTASDVYQLGLLLRLLATDSIVVRSEDERLPGLPRDVQLIVAKATHAEPARRYASAAELADDVRRSRAH